MIRSPLEAVISTSPSPDNPITARPVPVVVDTVILPLVVETDVKNPFNPPMTSAEAPPPFPPVTLIPVAAWRVVFFELAAKH